MEKLTVFDFSAPLLDGREQSLAQFRGQVLLIVNTASKCGFTPQYAALESLYQTYRHHGFAVLGFPSQPVRCPRARICCRDRPFLRYAVRSHFSSFRQNRSQWPRGASSLSISKAPTARPVWNLRLKRHPLELYEISHKPKRTGDGEIRARTKTRKIDEPTRTTLGWRPSEPV